MCDPVLIERWCGGWLALSPSCVQPRIGVTSITRDEAVAQWRRSIGRWREDLGLPPLACVHPSVPLKTSSKDSPHD